MRIKLNKHRRRERQLRKRLNKIDKLTSLFSYCEILLSQLEHLSATAAFEAGFRSKRINFI